MFSVPFEEIGAILERSPEAARQLASRGRRRIRGANTTPDADAAAHQEVVEAFLAAARDGDFDALLAVLDPDVVLRADRVAVQITASRQAQGVPALSTEVRGAAAVADIFSGRARAARLALVDGAVGAVVAPGGRPRVVFGFTIMGGKVAEIDILADPARLARLDLTDIDSRL
jgi:RNA polymerase sigma-70 factor (ECF subfamily)